MTASRVWQTPNASALVYLLIWIVRFYEAILVTFYNLYLYSVGYVLDNRVTDVAFYDLESQTRDTVMSWSNPIKVVWLVFLKLFAYQMYESQLCTHRASPIVPAQSGVYEITFFSKQHKWIRTFSRDLNEPQCEPQKRGTYLFASVNGKQAVTGFVNDNLASFNAQNAFTAEEAVRLINLAALRRKKEDDAPGNLFLITDDTLDEINFQGDDIVVLA